MSIDGVITGGDCRLLITANLNMGRPRKSWKIVKRYKFMDKKHFYSALKHLPKLWKPFLPP